MRNLDKAWTRQGRRPVDGWQARNRLARNDPPQQEQQISPPPPLPSRHRTAAGTAGRRRRGKAQALVETLQKRLRQRSERRGSAGKRRTKRKAALALSAGVIGLGSAAMSLPPPMPAQAAPALKLQVEKRKRARFLSASEALLEAMIEEEGARRTVYRDVAGYPTVGVGHLVTPEDGLEVGDRISSDQVIDFLEQDIATAERAVVRLVGDLPLFQNEFDALVDLVFNVGEGNVSAERSPRLNAAIAAADYDAIARELDYHYARGRVAKGLVYRSERRTNIFMDASYENPRETAGESSVA